MNKCCVLWMMLILTVSAYGWPEPPAPGQPLPEPSIDIASMSLSNLFHHAQVYAVTPQLRADKMAAREAFMAREEEALSFLVSRIDIENLWIRVMAFELARKLPDNRSVPILAVYLDDGTETQKRYALFLLGLFEPPDPPPDLVRFLGEEKLRGSAIRTLGKWKIREAVEDLIPFLSDEKERIRIMTANALGDIGDPSAIPALEKATEDRYFTVRKTAEESLRLLREESESPNSVE